MKPGRSYRKPAAHAFVSQARVKKFTPLRSSRYYSGRGPMSSSAQNLWRRWYLEHNLPRIGGEPQPPVASIQVEGSLETSLPGVGVCKIIEHQARRVLAGCRWRADVVSSTGPYLARESGSIRALGSRTRRNIRKGSSPSATRRTRWGCGFCFGSSPSALGDLAFVARRESSRVAPARRQ